MRHIKNIWAWLTGARRKFMALGIAKKMLLLMFSVSLVPLMCTLFMFYWLSASTMRAQTRELIQANLEQSASNVQNFWQTYENIIQSIYIDDFYAEKLEPINLWDYKKYHFAKAELTKRLENILYTNEEILGILLVGSYYDTCFYDSVTGSGQTSFCFDIEHIRKNPYTNAAMEEDQIVYSGLEHISDAEYGNRDVLYLACQLRNFEDYSTKPIGCVMLCVDGQALVNVYGKSNTRSNLTLVTNQYGDILSFPQDSLAGVNLLDGRTWDKKFRQELQAETQMNRKVAEREELEEAAVRFLKEKEYLEGEHLEAVDKNIADGRFHVMNVQNTDYAMRNFQYVVKIMLLFGVLAGLLCMLLAIGFSEHVDGLVKPILCAMERANQGDLKVKIKITGNDEFAWISRQFNYMIQQIHISNEQEKDALVRKKNAEIKALEAQINPHFLYNTLDTINWVAIDRQEYTISRMLTSLATILRYSIHKSNEMVEISSELEYLRKYVHLQQQRFDYSFVCTVDADESIRSYKIHKLLIQPLLENTLVHGFPGYTGMDEISIHIQKTGDSRTIQIMVEDNGIGMEPQQVEQLNAYEYQNDAEESGIGVRNVITRLKLYYGELASFHMESGKEGTQVTMRLPYTQ